VNVFDQLGAQFFTVKALAETGVVRPIRPDRLVGMGLTLAKWGPTPAAGYRSAAIRHPDRLAIIDELGTLSFRDVDQRSNALAHALRDEGVKEGDGVAIMCRNHRGFIDTTVALSKLGANALYLNTMFAGPQIQEVCEREKPVLIVYDEEFAELCSGALEQRKGLVAWSDGENPRGDHLLEELVSSGRTDALSPPSEKGRVVILTSGTTGTPKGASRKQPESLAPAAALFSKIPLRARQHTHIAAPLFHSWGFAHFSLAMALGSTLVLRRKWTPEGMLNAVAEHQCTALVVVPVMLQRTLELADEVIDKYDVSSLKVIGASGSALPGELALRVMDHFGDVLYNLYGSTEVAWATVATPKDMRAAPGTAGKPPFGTVVRLYDPDGKPVAAGETGRIFVGNEMAFEGYTGGGGKDLIDGLLSTGDVGHFDDSGRLFVDGRDDEMIVSGGENVFPREVEDLLADHASVEEAAVLGVEDDEYGQRLKAFIVLRDGKSVDEAELKGYIKSNLAGFKVPREIVFLDELPRNATGKVVKRELEDA
jgi:acyl-CoA synthetase (AMP-forming)/AMP-acid ligase II